ncbi:nuclear transport factor 2 family protein [Oerskovia sp. Sa1BUA8]|uniref:Nuclear transport factor 2 family protein n=1 Tax=Oerskovia douganii TaxID=2762210 RepID=A0A9D5UBM5_9CELL|nr:nuclear transport factor 2 family protein [Oerskovia douganii]MBE7700011.1 nuclear transport factor 2 family protein [Oerskovia douganii]
MRRRDARPERSVEFDLTRALDDGGEVLLPATGPSSVPGTTAPVTGWRARTAVVLAAVGGALAGAVVTWGVVHLASGSPVVTESAEVTALRQIERARLEDLVGADEDATGFAGRLAEDFVLVDVSGTDMSKSQLVEAVAAGELDFRSYDPAEGVDVRLHGPTAVVQHRSDVEIALEGVGTFRHPIVTTVFYEQQDGRWLVVRESSTSVGPLPEPVQD